jgi:hypothetical protein
MAKLQPRVRTCAVVVFRANELQKPPQLWETATPAVLKMGMKTTTTFPLSKTCSTTRSGRELQAPGAQLPSEPTARNRRITPIACYRVARAGDLGSPQKRRPGRASTTAATASAPVQREVLQLRSGDPTRGSQHSLGRRAFIPDRGALAFARLCSFRERSSSFKAKILPLPSSTLRVGCSQSKIEVCAKLATLSGCHSSPRSAIGLHSWSNAMHTSRVCWQSSSAR